MKLKLAILALSLLVSGCASVPQTELKLPTELGVFEFNSPKQIYASNVVVRTTGKGQLDVQIGTITSRNDADVIATVAAANAEMAEKFIEAMRLIQAMAASGAMKGVAP